MNGKNIRNGVSDFIPSKLGLVKEDEAKRASSTYAVCGWTYSVNRYVTIRNLQRKVGVFAEGNFKSDHKPFA